VKLLLDENLSRRIVPFLQGTFPGSSQVVLEGLERAEDGEVWQFARDHGFVIVTKDSDFHELSLLRGAPPKVVWLRAGNSSKAEVVRLLLENASVIDVLATDEEVGCVEIE
jgi:predicted nuclease of predicted toxin-antitoxin system